MFGRIRIFYLFGVILLVLATVPLVEMAGRRSAEAAGESLYQKLTTATLAGDTQAASLLSQFGQFCQSVREGGCSTPPQEISIAQSTDINGAKVYVEGLKPFYLKVYNDPEWSDATVTGLYTTIDGYIAARKAVLTRLAGVDPARQIDVSISLNQTIPLGTMWSMKSTYGIDVDQMSIEWVTSTGEVWAGMIVGDPNELGDRPYIDFDRLAEDVASQLRTLYPEQERANRDPNQLQVRVTWLRGKMKAVDASELSSHASTMLVDPVTDILAPYERQAAEVRVVQMPDLYEVKKALAQMAAQP